MTNAELIKALRCKTNNVNDCTMCAYHNACYDGTLEMKAPIGAEVTIVDACYITHAEAIIAAERKDDEDNE